MKKKFLLGVCPVGKFVFSHEDAVRQKKAIFRKLDQWGVSYCTIDGVLPDGLVRDQKHVEPVVAFLRAQNVDALFVPHCNFGTEGAVGMIAKRLGVPVLLWGPRDEAPLGDGSRLRDSLCGMFASSKVLRKLGVPFTYVENCSVEDEKFRDGVSLFLRAARVVQAMRTMRIGQVGVRIDFFWTTIGNESELLERFGVEVLPIDMVEFLRAVKARARANRKEYAEELNRMREWLSTGEIDEISLHNSLALRDELLALAEAHDIDAFAVKSFNSLQQELGPGNGLGDALVQEKIPIAAETDIHGAVSSVLLRAACHTESPVFFPEFTVRHPQNDNAVLLWHASAPPSLRHSDVTTVEILPPWILKGLPPSSLQFLLRDGPLTVCRFDGDSGTYVLGVGQGRTVPGPPTREIYAWMEVDDWPHWERTIMEGPYIHHCSCVYDHCADALEEACRYMPGLAAQRFDRSIRTSSRARSLGVLV